MRSPWVDGVVEEGSLLPQQRSWVASRCRVSIFSDMSRRTSWENTNEQKENDSKSTWFSVKGFWFSAVMYRSVKIEYLQTVSNEKERLYDFFTNQRGTTFANFQRKRGITFRLFNFRTAIALTFLVYSNCTCKRSTTLRFPFPFHS